MHRIAPRARINNSVSADWSLDVIAVENRRIQYNKNNIVEITGNRWQQLVKDTLMDPMILFLVGTSALFALLGDYRQTMILLLATIPLLGMDAFLHWRTDVSTRNLSHQLAGEAIVIRNGFEFSLPAAELVPGDLVVMRPGNFFPADGLIVAGKELQAEESALTGESAPVQKRSITSLSQEQEEPHIDYIHWGFAGTRLLTGRALLRIVYTGKDTLYGEIITSALRATQGKTPLQNAIAKLVLFLIVVTLILCFALATIRYYQGFGVVDAILSAATLAVAALPDEFPVVFTFFLGVGVYRLAQKKALVRRSVSIENIGRITCICSDKTGTITEGRFQLVHLVPAEEFSERDLLYISAIASRLESSDPLDAAIIHKAHNTNLVIPQHVVSHPFTEDRKRETNFIAQQHGYLAATKGSPETILSLSSLTEEQQTIWFARISPLARVGYKIIACARISFNNVSVDMAEPAGHYQFMGILAFADPVRKEVYPAVAHCRQSNIHVLMITGDYPETARAIASQIGLGAPTPKVFTANEIESLIVQHGEAWLRTVDVIARALPAQKLAFVQALKRAGEIVAVTGDGINDVPALKAADVGIAMGERGTQSAREVASIVLLDDNFGSIVNAIAEGRQLFKNLKLSFKYLVMIHIPFIFSAAIIPLLGYPLPYYPIHIVCIELMLHPTALLVFQNLPTHKTLDPIKPTPHEKIHFFSRLDWSSMLLIGIYSTALIILSYILILKSSHHLEYARGFAFTMLGCTSAAITIGLTGLRNFMARIITSLTLLAAVVLVQIPNIARFLNLSPLSGQDWAVIALCQGALIGLMKLLPSSAASAQ